MSFDGAGIFSRTPGTRIANAGALVSAQVNDETDNLVNGVNGKVNLDGKLAMTGLQTLFGDGTAVLHPATVQQLQKEIISKATAVGGTVDAITITMSPASTTWTTKETLEWVSGGANATTTPTISKDAGVSSKVIVSSTGTALAIGALGISGVLNRGYYDGTNVRLISSVPFTGGALTTTTSMTAKAFNEAKGAAVASAATTDIWTPADGNFLHITGTVAITSLGTAPQAGAERTVIFDGILTLTHNATSLILPGGVSITTAANDRMIVRADTTANMIVVDYIRASGQPIIIPSGTPVLLNTLTASASASLQDTTSITSAYQYYKIVFENLVPVTNSVSFTFQPFISAVFQTATLGGMVGNSGGVGPYATAPTLNGNGVLNTAGYGLSGELQIKNPLSTTVYKIMNIDTGYSSSSGLETGKFTLAYTGSQAAMTGFKVIPTSGNISTGTIKIYGWN